MALNYYYDIPTSDGRILRFSTTSDKASEDDLTSFFRNAIDGSKDIRFGLLVVPDWITVTEIEGDDEDDG